MLISTDFGDHQVQPPSVGIPGTEVGRGSGNPETLGIFVRRRNLVEACDFPIRQLLWG